MLVKRSVVPYIQCAYGAAFFILTSLLSSSLLADSLNNGDQTNTGITTHRAEPSKVTASFESPISENATWRALLHYNSSLLETKSSADSEEFFLSPRGKTDPELEYRANREKIDDETYLCRFPARARFIMEREEISGFLNKIKNCPELDDWLKALESKKVSLVFPSSFLNNPASAFGHTLLRLHTQQSVNTPLISYAINFSAKTGGDGALPYAFKGVFGGYMGYFDVAPYYERLRLYSESENRDIWEFTLNFSPTEIQNLLLHLWELRSVGFSYYYFDDNCSAILLELLESAKPGTALRKDEKPWIIPLDTMQRIQEKGLLDEEADPVFRPSPLRSFRARLAQLTEKERRQLRDIVDQKEHAEHATNSANTLDAAIDYIYYRMFAKYEQEKWEDQQFSLLAKRSALGIPPTKATPTVPSNPLMAHASSRFSLGAGHLNSRAYASLEFRGAYHEILDSSIGHSDESEIEFTSGDLRIFDDGDVQLQSLDLLHIRSLPLYGEFISPLSWGLDLGYEQNPMSNPIHGSVQFGYTKPTPFSGRGWLHIGGKNEIESGVYRVGPKAEIGLLLPLQNKLRAQLLYNYSRLYGENAINDHEAELGVHYQLSKNTGLRLTNSFRSRGDDNWHDSKLSVLFYY